MKNSEDTKRYNKTYRLKHKAKLSIKDKIYRQNNKEKCKERDKLYYIKNKTKIIKRSALRYKNNKLDIIEKGKLWLYKKLLKDPNYSKNLHNKYRKGSRHRNRKIVYNMKINGCCRICQLKNWLCLEFHHIDESSKKYNISKMVSEGRTEKSLLLEISKCELLCRNCHRKHHIKHNNITTQKAKYVLDIKKRAICCDCSESDARCLDFHHLSEESKTLAVATMAKNKDYSLEDVRNEISKCIIICSNCHMMRHADTKSKFLE